MNQKEFNLSKLGEYSKKLLNYDPNKERKLATGKNSELRILRVLCQRPYFTGSGINLVNLTTKTSEKGLAQFVIFGHPTGVSNPLDDIIRKGNTLPVKFLGKESSDNADIPFPVAGMSDQMPYDSTRFSTFDENMLETYLEAFGKNINTAVKRFEPNIIHSHHLWLVTSLCRVLNPNIPLVATCHNTGLRQMELASQLSEFMVKSIRDIDSIGVIDIAQQQRVEKIYEFDQQRPEQFFYIGQGINTDIFCPPKDRFPREDSKKDFSIIYVGKLSFSKGVPQLIKAFKELCREEDLPCELLLVGSGKGKEKERIYSMGKNTDNIHFLGQIEQEELSRRFRESDLFVLPSFYDGFPKVLLESLSSGCRAIITGLPGIKETLEKSCGKTDIVQYIPQPEMKSIDQPKEEELPKFIKSLKTLMKNQLILCETGKKDFDYAKQVQMEFSWEGLFNKYLERYHEVL